MESKSNVLGQNGVYAPFSPLLLSQVAVVHALVLSGILRIDEHAMTGQRFWTIFVHPSLMAYRLLMLTLFFFFLADHLKLFVPGVEATADALAW